MKKPLPAQLAFLENRNRVQKTSTQSMKGKLCIISGATSGVGLSAMRELAKGQANIVMVCRNLDKAKTIQKQLVDEFHVDVDIVIADFSVMSDVRRAADEILKRYSRIDVLINSVGVHSTKKRFTKDNFEMVFAVNHLSVFLFTSLLLERMKSSAPSRIIQVNSEGHRFSNVHINDLSFKKRIYTGLRSYGASKTAQLMTVWEFADLLQGSGVTINAMHPGAVRTNIGNNNGRLYRWFLHHVTWHFLKDPIISGQALYYFFKFSRTRQCQWNIL